MCKSQYKCDKKRNKCDVIIKSIITKKAIGEKKIVETIKKNLSEKKQNWRERKSYDLFCHEQQEWGRNVEMK